MLSKSTASAVLALIMAPSVSAAWTHGVSDYILDSSKQACVATTQVRNNADLTLIFPRDKKSLPIVRVTEKFSNFLNGKKYLGVRFLDQTTGLKVHGFPVKSGRTQYYYMVPKSSTDFKAFMTYIRAKGSMKMLKLFNDKGQIKANSVEFSLSGSTNATNAIKSCLGSTTFLSDSQSRLIDVLDKYKNDAVAGNPGTNQDSINRRGSNMVNSLRRVMQEGDRLEPLESELSTLENNERYVELKKSYETNTAVYNTQKKIVDTLTDNQNFYDNADEIIADFNAEIARLETLIGRLEAERGQISDRLDVIEEEIDRQQVVVNRKRETRDTRSQELLNIRSLLSQVNTDISNASIELGQKEERLRNLQLDVRPLRQNLRIAEGRYRDRDRLKREARTRLFDRYGRPDALRNSISDAQGKADSARAVKKVNVAIKSTVGSILAKTREIEGIDKSMAKVSTKISCLEKLIADGGEQASGKVCDTKVRGSLADTLQRIKGRRAEQQTKRDSKVSSLNEMISGISAPSNGRRILQAIGSLKSCNISDVKDCRTKAEAVKVLAEGRIASNNAVIIENDKKAKEASAKLAAFEKAFEENVRGLDDKLREEVRAASAALRSNEIEIDRTIDRVDFLERELSVLGRSQARLSGQLGSAQAAFSSADAIYEDTVARLEEYKRSVGYQQILNRQSVVIRQISQNGESLKVNKRSLASSIARKERVAAEVDTYPARITDATEKRDTADQVLNDIGPEYLELDEDVTRVRFAYNRVVRLLKPDLIRYQAEFKTVIKNLF